MRPRLGALALSVLAVGCASAGRGDAAACGPTTGALTASTSLAPLAGDFVLTLVATPARQVAGYLHLRAAPPGRTMGAARLAFVGTTDVRVEGVGAQRIGDVGGTAPDAPGVGVYEARPATGAPSVTARIGSLSNMAPTPGLTAIEGSYFTLFIARVDGSGFAGSWRSGTGPVDEVRGPFCAVRVS